MQGEAERALRGQSPSLPNRPHFDAGSIDSAIPKPFGSCRATVAAESLCFAQERGMLHTFYRQDPFDLVWSEPTRTIAKRLGISDVGLAKACRRAD
jgi:hypothetical protein